MLTWRVWSPGSEGAAKDITAVDANYAATAFARDYYASRQLAPVVELGDKPYAVKVLCPRTGSQWEFSVARHYEYRLTTTTIKSSVADSQPGTGVNMVDRTPTEVKPTQETEDRFCRLLEQARDVEMSPEDKEEQRRSFVFGNTSISRENITRELVDEVADRMQSQAEDPGKE